MRIGRQNLPFAGFDESFAGRQWFFKKLEVKCPSPGIDSVRQARSTFLSCSAGLTHDFQSLRCFSQCHIGVIRRVRRSLDAEFTGHLYDDLAHSNGIQVQVISEAAIGIDCLYGKLAAFGHQLNQFIQDIRVAYILGRWSLRWLCRLLMINMRDVA